MRDDEGLKAASEWLLKMVVSIVAGLAAFGVHLLLLHLLSSSYLKETQATVMARGAATMTFPIIYTAIIIDTYFKTSKRSCGMSFCYSAKIRAALLIAIIVVGISLSAGGIFLSLYFTAINNEAGAADYGEYAKMMFFIGAPYLVCLFASQHFIEKKLFKQRGEPHEIL